MVIRKKNGEGKKKGWISRVRGNISKARNMATGKESITDNISDFAGNLKGKLDNSKGGKVYKSIYGSVRERAGGIANKIGNKALGEEEKQKYVDMARQNKAKDKKKAANQLNDQDLGNNGH